VEEKCWTKDRIQKVVQEQNKAQNASTNSAPNAPQTASITAASSFYTSPIQTETYTSWNADTGASSHMTPHRHWLRNYRPHCIEISLADGSVVYSEGIGSVQFEPIIDGRISQIVEFTNVLYVPALRNNLLSVLYLTMNRNFRINIIKDTLNFDLNGKTQFVGKVNSYNSAFLQGQTIPLQEFVNLSSSTTIPMDLSLWHR
jgi:hypothetical protein